MILFCYWIAAVAAVVDKSATFDENVYLTGGYSYWYANDYRLDAESGHLTQRIAALPLLLIPPAFPDPGFGPWRTAQEWAVAPAFVYDSGNDADKMLWSGRVACATLSVLVGLLVYLWSRALFGPAAGFISLTLFAFCPTMLGNGPIVQSDMAAALLFPAAVAGVWATLHRVSPTRVVLSCAALSGLFLAKLSGPLIVPVAAVMVVLRLARRRPLIVVCGREWLVAGRTRQAVVFAAVALIHALVVWAAVWAAFGFRFAAMNHPGPEEAGLLGEKTRALCESAGPSGRVIQVLYEARLLPEAYLYGLAYQAKVARQRKAAYLNGEFYPTGTLKYFPYSWLAKTPVTFVALLGMAAWAWVRSRWGPGAGAPGLYDLAPLLTLLVVYAAATTASRLNIGHRYLAPVYPPLFVLAGAAASWFRPALRNLFRPGWQAVMVAVLLAAFVVESLATWPEYLTYFNLPAGGSRNGYRHLVDSSLDWGQDLPALKRWLDDHGLPAESGPVLLAYFGTASVEHYGIRAARIYHWPPHEPAGPRPALTAGVYCVSATALSCVYMKQFRGPWTAEYEADYQRLLRTPRTYEQVAELHEAEFARLCDHLRRREPDDRVGNTILVYRVAEAELEAALGGSPQ